jgi:hypothetical protein
MLSTETQKLRLERAYELKDLAGDKKFEIYRKHLGRGKYTVR